MLDAKYEGYEPWEIPAGTRKAGCRLSFFEAIVFIPEQIGVHLNSLKLIMYGKGLTFAHGWR